MTRSRLVVLASVALIAACTKNERTLPPPPPPPAPQATVPPTAPSAMTNPDDVAHATYTPSLGVDIASMTKLPNGVYYKDLKVGSGPAAGSGSTVAIHYVGRLPDGTQFDANQSPAPPFQFHIDAGEVVPGFDWGVKGMKAGGQRLAIIPPSLGYGARPYGPLPANAILVFVLDLVSTTGGR